MACGAYLIAGDHSPFARRPREFAVFWGIVCVLFFGATALNALLSVLRPGRLTLDVEGYRFSGWFTGPTIGWPDVERFEIKKIAGSSLVEARMRSGERNQSEGPVRRGVRTLVDGYNLANLTVGPKLLLETLEDWRKRHGRAT